MHFGEEMWEHEKLVNHHFTVVAPTIKGSRLLSLCVFELDLKDRN